MPIMMSIPQYPLAGKRIDLLVEGLKGRLAVECDGDHVHGPEHYERDLARQLDLERCGLKFNRILYSSYHRNPEESLKDLELIIGISVEKVPSTSIIEATVASSTQFNSKINEKPEQLAFESSTEIDPPDEAKEKNGVQLNLQNAMSLLKWNDKFKKMRSTHDIILKGSLETFVYFTKKDRKVEKDVHDRAVSALTKGYNLGWRPE